MKFAKNELPLQPNFEVISVPEKNTTTLNLLFYKEGFSFFAEDGSKASKVSDFKVSHANKWEVEIMRELEVNLRLRRNFDKVNVCFITSFFNLVPVTYLSESPEALLNFSEAEFENNRMMQRGTRFENAFVYGISQILFDKLKELYGKAKYYHSGNVFLDSIASANETWVHLNLYEHNFEIAVTKEDGMIFYNLFETQTGEDILFYTLFVLEQLNIDANQAELKCYGQLLPDTQVFQTLKKYIRFVFPASKNEDFLENFTLFNLSKCESSQVLSEEKK